MGVTRKQNMPNFPKKPEHFLPPDTHKYVRVSGGKKCSFFREIWRALFFYDLRLEIRLFALLTTICESLNVFIITTPRKYPWSNGITEKERE